MARRSDKRFVKRLDRPATWEDLDNVPDQFIGEIVSGELVLSPRPNMPHAVVSSDLGTLLGGPFRFGINGPGGWRILDEPYIRFGEDVRAPDLAGWRNERLPHMTRRGPITVVPDWICEILSSSTVKEDRGPKLDLYARARVPHVWLIDPLGGTVEVFRLVAEGWLRAGTFSSGKARIEPFDAVELDLSLLFGPEEPGDADE